MVEWCSGWARLWFESLMVLPQGVAVAVPVLSATDFKHGGCLAVDVGYRTTDYILVEKFAMAVWIMSRRPP